MEFQTMAKLKKPNIGHRNKKHLPQDLLFDVFSRLPVKALSRFKAVSKTWHKWISDPCFVKFHRQQSMKKMRLVGLFKRDNSVSVFQLDNERYVMNFMCMFSANPSPGAVPKYVCPISCDIICFTTNDHRVCLLNPSKRQAQVLPKTSTCTLFYSKLGFVYSSSTNKYKAVHLFLRRYGNGSITNGMECETFTFSDPCTINSSSWVASKQQCPQRVYPNSVSITGRIYWLVREYAPASRMTNDVLIVSFDSVTENFKIISRPSSWPLKNYKNFVELLAVEGNLCVVDVNSMKKKSVLDVWMLKEDCYWEQFYSIQLHDFRSICKGQAFSPKYMFNGEIFFVNVESAAAKSYNIKTRASRNVTFMDGLGLYWESLYGL